MLEAIRSLSANLGSDPLLVQAAGGNTSLKTDGVMWIKASGTWLRDALAKDIFVPLDVAAWEHAAYRPVPGIIAAAEMLYARNGVAEIAATRADAQNLHRTTAVIRETRTCSSSVTWPAFSTFA